MVTVVKSWYKKGQKGGKSHVFMCDNRLYFKAQIPQKSLFYAVYVCMCHYLLTNELKEAVK